MAVDDVRRFLTQLERSSVGTEEVRAIRRMSAPTELTETISRSVRITTRKGVSS